MSGADFRPWRADYDAAAILAAAAVVVLFVLDQLGSAPLGLWVSLALVAMAFHLVARGFRRAYGKRLERSAVADARRVLESDGLEVRAGVLCAAGDADLLVSRKRKAVIEIKSWVRFDDARRRAVILQSESVRDCLGADVAVVWLPSGQKARRFFFWPKKLAGGIYFAGGSSRELRFVLRSLGV